MTKRSPIKRATTPSDERVVQLGDGRRMATIAEARAMAHPLRLRILRMCAMQELTNRQLADKLGRDPGTVLHHVRQLTEVGLLESAAVRTGESGALEKPYRATDQLRWVESTPVLSLPGGALAPIQAFQDELHEAGPESVEKISRMVLHLSPAEAEELATRLVAIFDEYAASDHRRLDRPAHGGIFVLHRLAD